MEKNTIPSVIGRSYLTMDDVVVPLPSAATKTQHKSLWESAIPQKVKNDSTHEAEKNTATGKRWNKHNSYWQEKTDNNQPVGWKNHPVGKNNHPAARKIKSLERQKRQQSTGGNWTASTQAINNSIMNVSVKSICILPQAETKTKTAKKTISLPHKKQHKNALVYWRKKQKNCQKEGMHDCRQQHLWPVWHGVAGEHEK